MSIPVSKEALSQIIAVIEAHAEGAELSDLVAAFSDPPPRPTVHRWTEKLISDGVVRVDTRFRPQRYFLADSGAQPDGQPDNRNRTTQVNDARSNNPSANRTTAAGHRESDNRTSAPAGAQTDDPPTGQTDSQAADRMSTAGARSDDRTNGRTNAGPDNSASGHPDKFPRAGSTGQPDNRTTDSAGLQPGSRPADRTESQVDNRTIAPVGGQSDNRTHTQPDNGSADVPPDNSVSGRTIAQPDNHSDNRTMRSDNNLERPARSATDEVGVRPSPTAPQPDNRTNAHREGSAAAHFPTGQPDNAAVNEPDNPAIGSRVASRSRRPAEKPTGGGLTEKAVAGEVTTVLQHTSAWQVGTGVGNLASNWLGRFIPPAWRPALKLALGGMASAAAIWAYAHAGSVWKSSALWYGIGAVLLAGAFGLGWRGARSSGNGELTQTKWAGLTLRTRYFSGGGLLALLALIVGTVPYRRELAYPSQADVQAFLVRQLGSAPVRIAKLTVADAPFVTDGSLRFNAVLVTTQPLYQTVDTQSYLRTHAAEAWTKIAVADALLRSSSGERLRAAAGANPLDQLTGAAEQGRSTPDAQKPAPHAPLADAGSEHPNVAQRLTLLTLQCPAAASALWAGELLPWRDAGRWNFTPKSPLSVPLRGDPRPPGDGVFAIDDSADVARLTQLLATCVGYADKVAAAARDAVASTPTDNPKSKIENPTMERSRPVTDAAATAGTTTSPSAEAGTGRTAPAAPITPPPAIAPVENPKSRIEISENSPPSRAPQHTLPAFPTARGAYVLADGGWVALPQNGSKIVQSAAQKTLATLSTMKYKEARLAGEAFVPEAEIANLVFDGTEAPPTISARDPVVLIFVGPLAPVTADMLKRYPELKGYPVIELASTKTLSTGWRYAPLLQLAPGVIGFGPKAVAGAVESPAKDVNLLRCGPLSPGFYAFACGKWKYELAVR